MHSDCSFCPYHDRCLEKACIRETRHEIDAEVSVNITAHELIVVGSCPCMAGKGQAFSLPVSKPEYSMVKICRPWSLRSIQLAL